MTHIITKTLFAGLIATSTHLYAEDYDFKPGLWEIASTTEIVKIDASPEIEKIIRSTLQVPIEKTSECIKDLDSIISTEANETMQCKTEMKRVSAKKVILEELCTSSDNTSKIVGEFNLNGETFTSNINVSSTDNAMKVIMKVIGNGKYIGACK